MSVADAKGTESAFHLVVLAGPDDAARGFLCGLYAGAGHAGFLDFTCSEAAERSLRERLRELAGHGYHRAVVDGRGLALLRGAGANLEQAGLRLAESHLVRGAAFPFGYRAYAARYTEEIRAILAALPAGASREGGDPEIHRDPEAKGSEGYAPMHDYEARGEGRVSGPVDLVIAARAALAQHALVRVGHLELDLG